MSIDCHLTASANRKHVIHVAEGSYHLQLIRSHFNQALSGLPSIVILHYAHLLSILYAVDAGVAHSCTTDIAWETYLNSTVGPGLYCTSCAFTLNPFSSMAIFCIKSLLTYSSSDSVLMTGLSAFSYHPTELQSVTHATMPPGQ